MIRTLSAGLVVGLLSLAAMAEKSSLEFDSVWVRAMPPFQTNSAGYLGITNHGDVAVAIVGASSNVAKSVELHTTRKVDGLMRMEPLEVLVIAPGERVELAPGGSHLMLLGLSYRLVPGDDVTLCLQLATDEEVCTDAEVRRTEGNPNPGTGTDADTEHHHH